MNTGVGRAQIGQWYLREDKGESFLVTGFDEDSGTIEIQSFDGDIDEIDEELWATLPLELAEPSEDGTGPLDYDADLEGVPEEQFVLDNPIVKARRATDRIRLASASRPPLGPSPGWRASRG